MAPPAPVAPKKSAGKLIVTITLILGFGGGLVALYFGRELVEARRARMMPRTPATAPATTPPQGADVTPAGKP
ncbi:MAG TPA: hypothetical protein VGF45_08825 [Polyangia bacterium]